MTYTPTTWENGKTRLNADNLNHLERQYDAALEFAEARYATQRVDGLVLPKFRKGLAAVRAGVRDAKVLCIGDSTTAGVGSDAGSPANQGGLYAYPHQMARVLSAYAPASRGLAVPPSQLTKSNPDPRWMPTTGWSLAAFGWGNGADYTTAENTTTPLTFTDSVAVDTYDIYYLRATGLGKFTAQATGGSAVSVNTAGTSAVLKTTISAGAASTSNTVTITPTATTPVHILGIEGYLSSSRQIRVGNAGVGGSTTTNWVAKSTDFGGVPAIQAYAPDLTIISLGINDANASTPPATVAANVQKLVAAAQVTGDVLLVSPFPSASTADPKYATFEPQYSASLRALGLPYADLFRRFGDPGSTTSTDLGLMSDPVHPNAMGYADLSQFLAVALAEV